jgi:hypothetical protein
VVSLGSSGDRDRAGSQGSPWLPLGCNQLLGVRWRGRLLGPGRAVAELRTPWPWCVYDDAPIVVKFIIASLTRVLEHVSIWASP